MKPELIFVNEHDGLVTLPKEDLERIVDTAYKAGLADSYAIPQPWISSSTGNETVSLKNIKITGMPSEIKKNG